MATGGPPGQQERAQELQTAGTQVADDVGDVETQLQLLALTAPVARVTNAVHEVEAELQRPTPGDQPSAMTCPQRPGPHQTPTSVRHADMRQQLQAVAVELQEDYVTNFTRLEDPVVILLTSQHAVLDYASGESDEPPGPLQGPVDAEVAYARNTATISAATAGAAAAVLGQAALPRLTRRNGGAVLTLGGQPQHVLTWIFEQPGWKLRRWWLPAGVTAGRAAELALGYMPRHVTAGGFRHGEIISDRNMLAWQDETDTTDLHVWKF